MRFTSPFKGIIIAIRKAKPTAEFIVKQAKAESLDRRTTVELVVIVQVLNSARNPMRRLILKLAADTIQERFPELGADMARWKKGGPLGSYATALVAALHEFQVTTPGGRDGTTP